MHDTELNPYKAPISDLVTEEVSHSVLRKRWMLVGWACSMVVLAYGLFGLVANGADLLRTRSSRDLVTELRLLALFGFGCFLCWLARTAGKQEDAVLARILLILSLSGLGYVLYDAM